MKRILLLMGMMAILLSPSIAQPPGKAELREKMHAYVKENILPVITDERALFDSELSSAEKQKVQELRDRQKALHSAMNDIGVGRGMRKGGQSLDLTDADRDKLYELRKERRMIHTAAWEILDAHEDYLQDLHEELQDKMEVFQEEMQSMREDFRGQAKGDFPQRRDGRGPHHMGGHHGQPHHGGQFGFIDFRSPVRFLLMDPSQPEAWFEEMRGPKSSLYPNPTTNSQSLELELKKSGNVKIDLYDEKGNLVKSLYEGELDKGKQVMVFDLAGLPKKQYMYRITTPDGQETKRVVIE